MRQTKVNVKPRAPFLSSFSQKIVPNPLPFKVGLSQGKEIFEKQGSNRYSKRSHPGILRRMTTTALAQPLAPSRDPVMALAYLVTAVLLFETVGVCAKLLSTAYPVGMIVFARNAFALLPLAIGLTLTASWSSVRSHQPKLHLARGLVGMATMYCSFVAIRTLPLATLTALQFTMPFFMIMLATFFLKEKLTLVRTGAVLLGFCGAVLVAKPTQGAALDGAVVLALFGGTASVMARQLTKTDSSLCIAFSYSTFCALFGVAMLMKQGVIMPNLHDTLLFLCAGCAGGLAQLLLTQAYRHAPVNVIAPYEYTSLLWATLFGWIFWGDLPTVVTLLGAAVIVVADLWVLFTETKKA